MKASRPFHISEVFVGRDSELRRLMHAANDAASGHGWVVSVTGDPGIGKSRLLSVFAAKAATRAIVLEGHCSYAEGAPPYFPWVQIISGYLASTDQKSLQATIGEQASVIAEVVQPVREAIGRVDGPVRLESPAAARFRFFQSVATILRKAAEDRTLVLILHDLHWIDRSSAALLTYLLGELEQARLLLVVSYRDRQVGEHHPLRPSLAELARVPYHDTISLKGLTSSEVHEYLAAGVSEAVPTQSADLIHSATGGVPLFVRELALKLHGEGLLMEPSRSNELLSGVPASIRDLIGGWLGQLSPEGSDTVAVAAVLGMDVVAEVVAACCAKLPSDVMRALEEAVALSLLDPVQPGRFRFSHSLVRESILVNLSASREAEIHAQVAEGLVQHYGDASVDMAARIVHHFARAGGLAGTEQHVHYALIASEQAISAHANEGAIELLERTLATVDADLRTRAKLLFGLARARIALNEREAAVTLLTEAFDLFVRSGDVSEAVAAAEYPLVVSFRTTGIAQLSQKALALVEPGSLQAGKLECQYGLALAQEEREYGEARRACSRALELARSLGDAALEARSLLLSAFIEREDQNIGLCLERSLAALEISKRIPDLLRVTVAHHLAQESLIAGGNMARGRTHAANGLIAAEQLQDRFWLMLAYAANQRYRIAGGDWKGARDFSDRGLALEPNDPFLLANRARLEYDTGHQDLGEEYLARFLDLLRRDNTAPSDRKEYQNASVALVVPLICRIVDERPWLDLAEAAADSLLSSPRASTEWRFRAASCLGLAAAIRGDSASAQRSYDQLTEALTPRAENTVVFCRASLTFVQAQLARVAQAAGKFDLSMVHYAAAERACRIARHRTELAWVCFEQANLLKDAGTPKDATHRDALMNEADALASRYGMTPLVEKIRGLRESASSRAPRPVGLTQREVEVLTLLAQGKTNQEIATTLYIAERTASNHVSNILAKIDCSNRVEAAAFAHRHGLVKP